MKKYVIFNDFFKGLCGIPEEYYSENIQDKTRIQHFEDFQNADEVKDYLVKYFGLQSENIIIAN